MVKNIAVIGGGVSGLALVHYLNKRFKDTTAATLYERNQSVGGNIQTIAQNGFLFETGPNGFLIKEPATLELIEDLGLNNQLIEAQPKANRRYIQIHGQLRVLPVEPINFIQTPVLSIQDKCHVLRGLFVKNVSKDQSVYNYAARRFGKGAAEKLVDPFVSGVFAGDIRRLHMASAFPNIFPSPGGRGKGRGKLTPVFPFFLPNNPPHQPRHRRGKGEGTSKGCFSFKQGMGQLISRLHERYASQIKTGATVSSLEDIKADHIICTCPAYAASVLLAQLYPVLAKSLEQIYYAPVVVVGLAFVADAFRTKPDGFGYLIPSNQGKEILGVLIESNVFAGRAPDGMVMLRVMMGGRYHPQIVNDDPQSLIVKAVQELDEIYGLKSAPVHQWDKIWPYGIPQYEMEYPAILKQIREELTRIPHLTLCGNYLGGISFNDCINNAKTIANLCTTGLS